MLSLIYLAILWFSKSTNLASFYFHTSQLVNVSITRFRQHEKLYLRNLKNKTWTSFRSAEHWIYSLDFYTFIFHLYTEAMMLRTSRERLLADTSGSVRKSKPQSIVASSLRVTISRTFFLLFDTIV